MNRARTTRKNNTSTLKNGGKKKPSSRKTPMPVRPEGETIEQQQQPDNKRKSAITMSEPENMQPASEGNVSLSSSPPLQQQEVKDSVNMSSQGEELGLGAETPLEDSAANAPLLPSGEELPLLKVQNSENVSLSPPSLQEGQNSENVSLYRKDRIRKMCLCHRRHYRKDRIRKMCLCRRRHYRKDRIRKMCLCRRRHYRKDRIRKMCLCRRRH
jgi:hypothetical protein